MRAFQNQERQSASTVQDLSFGSSWMLAVMNLRHESTSPSACGGAVSFGGSCDHTPEGARLNPAMKCSSGSVDDGRNSRWLL